MTSFIVAAVLLTIGLLMFGAAQRHQTLLDKDVEASILARLERLAPETPSVWGRMSAGQMLRHLNGALRMATGDLKIPRRSSILRRFPIRQLIVFVLPFPKGAPTAPALVVKEDVDFEVERTAVRELIRAFPKRESPEWPEHPAFGPFTRDQWGVMVWKHVDHHFRQFGV